MQKKIILSVVIIGVVLSWYFYRPNIDVGTTPESTDSQVVTMENANSKGSIAVTTQGGKAPTPTEHPENTSVIEHPPVGVVPPKPTKISDAVYLDTKNKLEAAIRLVEKNTEDYDAWLEIAILRFSVFSDHKSAEAIWLFVEKNRPQMFQPVASLAQLYFRQGNLVQAETYLLKTIKNEPKFLQAYSDLHAIYKTQGQKSKAIAILKQGIPIEQKEHYLNVLLAQYYAEIGDAAASRVQYEEAYARAVAAGNTAIAQSIQEEMNR